MKAARILVIEENDTLRTRIAKAFKRAGYTTIVVRDFLDGLGKVYEVHPNVVIIGNRLPIRNGENSHVWKASTLPIIVLGGKDRAVETLNAGADVYMTKPPDIEELVVRTEALLRRTRPQSSETVRKTSVLSEELGLLNDSSWATNGAAFIPPAS